MNILMVSDVYFPRINGVCTSIITFRRELAKLGHRTVLIAPDYSKKDCGKKTQCRRRLWGMCCGVTG
jgi:hypothetical protein